MNTTSTIPADAKILPIRWCAWEDHPDFCHEPHEYELGGEVFLCPGGDFSKVEVREILEDGEPTLDGFTRPAEPQN